MNKQVSQKFPISADVEISAFLKMGLQDRDASACFSGRERPHYDGWHGMDIAGSAQAFQPSSPASGGRATQPARTALR